MSFLIENKTALVTGANRGIGKAIVESLLAHGAKKVYLAVRNIESTLELNQKYADKVETVHLDVADANSAKELASYVTDVDLVVNNAGVLSPASSLDEKSEQALEKEFSVNVFGLLRIANGFAASLIKNKGAFVQLNSVASIKNFAELSTYSASKAAAYSLTQGFRDQFAESGVQVLSVHPGPIKTDMAAQAGFDEGDSVTTVSEGIITALAEGQFHLFPDEVAKQFEPAYLQYSEHFIANKLN